MPTVDRDFTLNVLRDLVRINSINPALVPGAPGEREIARYTCRVLRDLGLDVREHEAAPGRVSVVGRLKGGGGGRCLMLNAHYDTVGVEGMSDPFSGDTRDGQLYGRGAYDMKGSLAACIGALKMLVDARVALAGDVLVAAVADEEHASLGTQDVIARYRVDGAIVTEPTALQICLAHKGFVWAEIETHGRAAHGSKPELGVDANLRMGRVLARLADLERALQQRALHPLVGRPSIHAATVHGGTGLSTYAASCRLQIERRTIPGERDDDIDGECRQLIVGDASGDPTYASTLRYLLVRQPFEVSREAPIVRAIEEAVRAVVPGPPRYVGETPWMDAALLAEAGVDTVVIGPDGRGAHSAEESVDVGTVLDLAHILARAAIAYTGAARGTEHP
jgi:acetylornithine deacetylase